MILLLLACATDPKDTGDTGESGETGESGDSADTAETGETGDTGDTDCTDTGSFSGILTPTDGAAVALGLPVALTAEWYGSGLRSITWSVDGEPVGDTLAATWVAAGLGAHTVSLVVDADCYGGTDEVTVTVTEATEASVTTFDSAHGLPLASWYGLSVAADGIVWGATSSGLVRFDPAAGTTAVYTSTHGLYTSFPRAVLAASDGTIWVGHVGDTTRQGEQVRPEADGSLTPLRSIDFTESTEITSVYRLREQPFGAGAGDVWMGTNEGLCLWDADLDVFSEHAHPTHPHDEAYGVAFTPDAHIWNGDTYQLSRWGYSDDGDLSPSADLLEFWVPWPVEVKAPVDISDADADGTTLWLASTAYGVARVEVAPYTGLSTTECLGEPFPAVATAIRADGQGRVWIGGTDGVHIWDEAAGSLTTHGTDWLASLAVQQIAVDPSTVPPTTWIATPYGLTRVVGLPE